MDSVFKSSLNEYNDFSLEQQHKCSFKVTVVKEMTYTGFVLLVLLVNTDLGEMEND